MNLECTLAVWMMRGLAAIGAILLGARALVSAIDAVLRLFQVGKAFRKFFGYWWSGKTKRLDKALRLLDAWEEWEPMVAGTPEERVAARVILHDKCCQALEAK